ncbi:MAG TPA: hypothetical protein VLA56_07665 [Pseudomonadales bacterium]|nr:hypothetical protein [Pseudomonadales bacterium]
MRTTKLCVLMVAALLAAVAGQARAAPAADDPAAACRACHQGEMALDRWSRGELVVRITKIRDGVTAHPPLGETPPDTTRVLALARALAGPSPAP